MRLPAIEAEGAGRLAVGDAAASYDPIDGPFWQKRRERFWAMMVRANQTCAPVRHPPDDEVVVNESDEGFSVSCPGLPGCWSEGETETEALGNIQDAIREYFAAIFGQAQDLPYIFMTVIFPS